MTVARTVFCLIDDAAILEAGVVVEKIITPRKKKIPAFCRSRILMPLMRQKPLLKLGVCMLPPWLNRKATFGPNMALLLRIRVDHRSC